MWASGSDWEPGSKFRQWAREINGRECCVSWAPGLGLGWEREIRSLDVEIVSVAQPATPNKLDSRNCKII